MFEMGSNSTVLSKKTFVPHCKTVERLENEKLSFLSWCSNHILSLNAVFVCDDAMAVRFCLTPVIFRLSRLKSKFEEMFKILKVIMQFITVYTVTMFYDRHIVSKFQLPVQWDGMVKYNSADALWLRNKSRLYVYIRPGAVYLFFRRNHIFVVNLAINLQSYQSVNNINWHSLWRFIVGQPNSISFFFVL